MAGRALRASSVVVLAVGAACSSTDGSSTSADLASPPRAAIEHAAELTALAAAYEDSWTVGDADLLASFLADDFVFNEPQSRDLDKDAFLALMRPMIGSEWLGTDDLHYFVGADEVVSVAKVWGFGGATEMAPIVEVDALGVHGGAISSIRAMYGAEFVWQHAGVRGAEELAEAYGAAWSSGDAARVEALYAPGAVRTTPLLGTRLQGADEIAGVARERFTARPDLSVAVVQPYVFSSADSLTRTVGAEYVVGDDQSCRVLVMLEPDEGGTIAAERVYVHAEAVESCSWW